jgi:hypothetical protein
LVISACSGRRDTNHAIENGSVKRRSQLSGGWIQSADNFRNVATRYAGIARVFAFWRKGNVDLQALGTVAASGFQSPSVSFFQNRNHDFFRGSGVGCVFQYHQLAARRCGAIEAAVLVM